VTTGHANPFKGSCVALPTPFENGDIDLTAFDALAERQVLSGSDALVVCGTTGEAATLTAAERSTLIARAVDLARGRVPVLAGVGTNATATTIELARAAAEAGANGLLVVTPYYNRPSQAGLQAHFGVVAEAVDLPLVLYNVPARTGVDLLPETAAALAREHATVVAIKEASGGLERLHDLLALAPSSGLDVLCGEDALAEEAVALGCAGLIGVVANLLPAEVADLVRTGKADPRLAPLVRALFAETNPVPLKAALALLGLVTDEVRLPLMPLSPGARARMAAALEVAGLTAARAAV